KKYSKTMLDSFKEFEVRSCHDLSDGGLAVAIAEMCIASGMGSIIDLMDVDGESYTKLFSESNTRWIVEVKASDKEDYIQFFRQKGSFASFIGNTGGDELEFKDGGFSFSVSLDKAEKAWRTGLVRYTGW
ncbi:MAG TPA: phosphoribosylformylglycinamidine synthase II, partial [Archaeoglobaceae archaeon]|nr:phosphoribosylformylglycinamidine synthase II [Archaeoglobaceae archaeon]